MAIGSVGVVMAVVLVGLSVQGQYLPDWSSLDTRPLPQWYDQAKFGIFIHWGVFSVPSTISEWFWFYWKTSQSQEAIDFMTANYPPGFKYQDFAAQFHAEFFDPNQWADLFQASGAKYVVLTSKHHEGYTLWPSSYSWNWNSKDVGPGKDLVGLLANAIRNRTKLHFGLYHSLFEWYNPVFLQDKRGGFVNRTFPSFKTMPELYEIVNNYRPEIIWSDGDEDASDNYWGSKQFIAWLYNKSPVKDTVVVNDRWGQNISCNHGDFYTCADRYNPGHLLPHKWENCMTIDKYSWGYRRNAVLEDFCTIEELLSSLISTVSCGGNLLLNVGPTAEGRIIPIFEERLRQMGQWLSINGEAIYNSRPWIHQNDTLTSDIWYTKSGSSGTAVYALFQSWPEDSILNLGAPITTDPTVVTLLGYRQITWVATGTQGLSIALPIRPPEELQWAWVLKLEYVK